MLSQRNTYAFVVEGQTEFWYLNMIKRRAIEYNIRIKIKPEIPTKKKIQDQVKLVEKLSKDYTMVFWVLDFDVIVREENNIQKFNDYRKNLLKYQNVTVIINNPCFEIWLLLHYLETSKIFCNCDSVIEKLKKFMTNYDKSKKFYTQDKHDIFTKTEKKLSAAIKNAKQLGEFDPNEPNKTLSEMFLIFDKIPEIKKLPFNSR